MQKVKQERNVRWPPWICPLGHVSTPINSGLQHLDFYFARCALITSIRLRILRNGGQLKFPKDLVLRPSASACVFCLFFSSIGRLISSASRSSFRKTTERQHSIWRSVPGTRLCMIVDITQNVRRDNFVHPATTSSVASTTQPRRAYRLTRTGYA